MSLIQVSSSQVAFKNQGIGQGAFNTGFRFSNFFNNVLEIPANAEIALHSAQFDMENTGGLDITFIGSDNDLNVPCMRILYATAVGDYATQNDNTLIRPASLIPTQVPVMATHLPLIFYMIRKKYSTMENFWEEWVDVMETEPRPLFQFKEDNTGTLISGWTTSYAAPAGVETETFRTIANALDSSVPNRRFLTSSTWGQGGGCGFSSPALQYTAGIGNVCGLTNAVALGEFRDVSKIAGGTLRNLHTPFWTQFEGINNAGGVITCRGFDCPAILAGSVNPQQGQGRKHQYTFGIKRWGVVNASATGGADASTRTFAVQQLASAKNHPLHTAIATTSVNKWSSAGVAATLKQYYYSAALLSSGNDGLSFQADCIADVFWLVSPRIATITGGGTKVGQYGQEMILSLWKYECGAGTGLGMGNRMNRIVCVATGDALASTTWDVCYSGILDPSNASFPAAQVLNNQAVGLAGGIGVGFQIIGNQVVPFISPGTPLTFSKNPTAWAFGQITEVFIPLSDVVYPLQFCGSMTGLNDSITAIGINPAGAIDGGLNHQSPVLYMGQEYSDYFKYVRAQQICPASIFNQVFLDQTTEVLYPLDSNVVTPQSITPYSFYDNLVPTLTPNENSLNNSPFAAVGFEPLLDVQPALANEYANNANISDLIRWDTSITPSNVLALVPDAQFKVSNTSYEIESAGSFPFLLGMYIKLKNLPNRATFGSLNQADCEKLISVINRYDEERRTAGGKTMYAYNEYDKLYIALNNPAPLFLSKLDFEVVDRFGNAVTSLNQTTIVLHLRPAEYKDFYQR